MRLADAVLHVDGSHVRVGALLEIHCNHTRTVVGGLRSHVGHVLHTIDALLKRRNNGVQHRLCIGTSIGGLHRNGRRRNIGVLLDRQRNDSDDTQQHEEDGDHRREHRALYKVCKCHLLIFLLFFPTHYIGKVGCRALLLTKFCCIVDLLVILLLGDGLYLHTVGERGDTF